MLVSFSLVQTIETLYLKGLLEANIVTPMKSRQQNHQRGHKVTAIRDITFFRSTQILWLLANVESATSELPLYEMIQAFTYEKLLLSS